MGLGEIYKITCNITNKSYIGQAVSNYVSGREHGTEHRWKIHVWDSKREKPRCKALASAIVKYGEHNFTVRTILICDESQLNYFEMKYNTLAPNGYNLRQGGGSRGRMSEYSRNLISIAKSSKNHHMYGKKY